MDACHGGIQPGASTSVASTGNSAKGTAETARMQPIETPTTMQSIDAP